MILIQSMGEIARDSTVFVAGSRGLVGSALVRKLKQEGFQNLLLPGHDELDLLDQRAVNQYFKAKKIQYVFVAAAKVGGIQANSAYPADFLYENVMISANVIRAAAENDTEKLLYLGSSCIYPRHAPQPIQEESLLTSGLEPTNEGYALAKIVGLKLCEMYQTQYGKRFISAMPTNLYGPGDNYNPRYSHVIPGMMARFHDAKLRRLPEVDVWGTGNARREFLHVDDLASAVFLLMENYESPRTINVGTGVDCTVRELAEAMKEVVGFGGRLAFDTSRPDGMPRKVLDVSRIRDLGWQPKVSLLEGLNATYKWALENQRLAKTSQNCRTS